MGFLFDSLEVYKRAVRRSNGTVDQLNIGARDIRKAMGFMFENLEVYRRAVDLAEKISGLTERFPAKRHTHLADQLRRASLSVSLNIAEGNGRWHAKERKNFFWIARGSVFECVPLLELCRREKLIAEQDHADLKAELEILARMLSALIKGTEKREQ